MLDHAAENTVRAIWAAHEKPILAALVVDAELVTLEGEINPRLGDVVGDILAKRDAWKCA